MEKKSSPISTKEMSLKRKVSIEVLLNSKPEDETKAEVSNEKPKEKDLKLSELSNMDPLEYFSRFLDISEIIFHNLSGKDLLVASEINPNWYNFIASSKVFMQKIKVIFDKPENLDDYNLLKNSSRLYQNIYVGRLPHEPSSFKDITGYVSNTEFDAFYSKAHEWKNVSLVNVNFRTKLDLWKLLSSIESSVESIFVRDIRIFLMEDHTSAIEPFEASKFLKLKKLSLQFWYELYFSRVEIFTRLILNSVAIEELSILDFDGVVDKNIFTKMLENFDKLTKLTLFLYYETMFQILGDEALKKFNFKLKSLSAILNRPRMNHQGINERNFLKSQSEYLEEIFMDVEEIDRETFDVILKMPKLKLLNLRNFQGFPENEVPNEISASINSLYLHSDLSAVKLKFLLDSMPKVICLKLYLIDEDILKMLKSMNRKFQLCKIIKKLRAVDRKKVE